MVAETHPCVMEFVGLTGYAESATPEQLLDKYGMLARDVELRRAAPGVERARRPRVGSARNG